VEGVPEKAIFRSVTVYNINSSSQCNLLAQIEQVQDNTYCLRGYHTLQGDNSLKSVERFDHMMFVCRF